MASRINTFCLLKNNKQSISSLSKLIFLNPNFFSRRIKPSENIVVALVAMGEGWHNYHHVFPWDYKAAELGKYSVNLTTMWLDLFSQIGWAYDMKQPSKQLVIKVMQRTGNLAKHDEEVNEEEDLEYKQEEKKHT